MMNLKVGSPLEIMRGRPEGCIFNIDDAGAILIYHFSRPTADEIQSMHEGQPFEIRFVEVGGLIWICSKCGTMQWTDAPYNPRLSHISNIPEMKDGYGLALTLLMTDADTAIIKSLRVIGLGEKFSEKLLSSTKKLRETEMSQREYMSAMAITQMKYTTKDLVRMSSEYYKLK